MNKDAGLIVVSIGTGTPEDGESSRLREYAKSSGPAGVGMSEERPEDKKEESVLDMAKRYGQEFVGGGADTLEALFGERSMYRESTMPKRTGSSIMPGGDESGFTMMVPDSYSKIDDAHGRNPDMVLMDWMGDEDEIESRYLTDLYPSDDRIDYLSRKAGGETLTPVRPDSVLQMTEDMRDYNRFGGDAVAMELDRRESDVSGREYTDQDNDLMLRALMESNVEYSGIQDAKEGFAAVREDLGRDVEIKLVGKDGTKNVYSAYSPQIGRLRYSYDSMTGVGRILGSE